LSAVTLSPVDRSRARVAMLALCTLLAVIAGCAGRPRMCTAPADCPPAWGACVAGRCQPGGRVVMQEAETRRLVFAPVDVAYIRRGEDAHDGVVPSVFTLGSARDGSAMLLLRFAVSLPEGTRIPEAYVILERTDATESDPTPIGLHAARILDPWDARSVSWARQPRIDDARTPVTTVSLARTRVRIDVRDLVRRWRLHDRADQGIAIVADGASRTGMAFALSPTDIADDAPRGVAGSAVRAGAPTFFAAPVAAGASDAPETASNLDGKQLGPRLELYAK
jgi:hypothetical protein